MEVEATVKVIIAGQTIVMTMEEAIELKAKLDAVVPKATLSPFMENPYDKWVFPNAEPPITFKCSNQGDKVNKND